MKYKFAAFIVAVDVAGVLAISQCSARAGGLPTQPGPQTPGAIASTSRAEVCTPGYSERHRLPPGAPDEYARWRRVIASYGLTPRDVRGRIEMDHLIPLCLGGADEPANLWPEPVDQAMAKDALEEKACRSVCYGSFSLGDAQWYFQSGAWRSDLGERK